MQRTTYAEAHLKEKPHKGLQRAPTRGGRGRKERSASRGYSEFAGGPSLPTRVQRRQRSLLTEKLIEDVQRDLVSLKWRPSLRRTAGINPWTDADRPASLHGYWTRSYGRHVSCCWTAAARGGVEMKRPFNRGACWRGHLDERAKAEETTRVTGGWWWW